MTNRLSPLSNCLLTTPSTPKTQSINNGLTPTTDSSTSIPSKSESTATLSTRNESNTPKLNLNSVSSILSIFNSSLIISTSSLLTANSPLFFLKLFITLNINSFFSRFFASSPSSINETKSSLFTSTESFSTTVAYSSNHASNSASANSIVSTATLSNTSKTTLSSRFSMLKTALSASESPSARIVSAFCISRPLVAHCTLST